MSDEHDHDHSGSEPTPWPQRVLDNIWLLLAISIVVPGLLYLAWGLWELAELPMWGGA